MQLWGRRLRHWGPGLGIGLAVAALGFAFIRGVQPGAIALFLLGSAIALSSWLFSLNWQQRSLRSGATAAGTTALILLLLILLNWGAVRWDRRLDLTEAQLNSLAPESQQVVSQLQQPLTLWFFSAQPDPSLQKLVQLYQRQSPQLKFERVDRQQRPDLAQRLGVKDEGDLILEQGDRRQFLVNQAVTPLSEARLTTAIANLQQTSITPLYWLQGHGEPAPEALAAAKQALSDRGYTVRPLNLASQLATGQTEIPEDAALVAIVAPERPLLATEVASLQRYIDRGGRLAVFAPPGPDNGLAPLLQPWGLTLDPRSVIDSSSGAIAGFGPEAPLVDRYGNHPITQAFGNGVSFFPKAGAILIAEKPEIQVDPLLISNDRSWAEADLSDTVGFDPARDLRGPLALAAAASRKTGNQEARIVVFGSSQFLQDRLFNQQLNGDVFLNSVGWLSDRQAETLSIRPRQSRDRRLLLTGWRATLVTWLSLILVPLAGWGAAGWLTWQRRRAL
ncbi:GldG family protein [Synechococcus elongatus]|uniref:ABC-type uncharacterized transport system domain-containing protein n=2 Tax=Synechococcus elongatus TaxID=32046 RepID=Q31S71_SYNE7|nr:Gldg family protein [Synechococcus elongatus]ABB56098.1 conserved hypothetical protein [Synechococcus elongatus PCC 7942 = FACHB-805]AJD56844.1 hypothetical protein M744_02765 [Synechococcus elongatus UTEX 2973]MBD2587929.1 Gldg family protein [Synechococcus elongatus FACHB-242]MBD2688997.1 Gldg family protein [Synechococcus elongatus FACHB-1061]MBD2707363.1 Gldg family protein [Synechococcus elongatus PCC 7942 = FACHB-805]